jgi:hypothetical protein
VLFLVSESAPIQRTLRQHHVLVPPKSERVLAFEQYPGLRAYASRRTVYHPVFTDLDAARTGRVYQDYDNLEALLASGYQPGHLVQALLARRFDVVYLLPDDRRHERDAGTGTWEDNYLWKLDQVMQAKYQPLRTAPEALRVAQSIPAGVVRFTSPGIFVRRPGPDPAPWMSRCFGPFHIAGVSWRIARGGGFWCRSAGPGDSLGLVSTRAGLSELRADTAPSVLGRSLHVTLPRSGRFMVARGSDDSRWRLRGRRVGGRVALELESAGRLVDLVVASPGPLTIRFAQAGPFGAAITTGPDRMVTVSLVRDSAAALSLWGSHGSGATFRLGGFSS